MKNKILTAILLLTLPIFLTGCTIDDLKKLPVISSLFGGSKTSNQAANLTIWGMWEDQSVIEEAVAKYKETHPNVTVTYDNRSIVGAAKYKDTVVTRLVQGGSPDIVLVHNSWLPKIKNYLSPSNNLTQQEYSQTFYTVATQSAVIDGQVYAVPAYYDGLVLVYNKKHFEEINQNTPPTAWEEFRRLALSLTQKTTDNQFVRAGAAVGSVNNIDFAPDILGLMLSQAGIMVPDDLTKIAAQDAFKFYTTFVLEDKVWSNDFAEASTAFAQGKVSMIFTTSWNLLDIKRANPTLDFGVAPVPQAIQEAPVTWGSFWMYAVPKGGQNVSAAWDFIKFLTSDEEELAMFGKASTIRPYGAPYASVGLASQLSSGPTAPYLKPLLDTAPFAKSGIFCGRSGNTTETDALKEAVNTILSKGFDGTSEALTTLKAKLVATQ